MKKVGPYTLIQRLGAGGFAEVHLAVGPTPRGPESLLALKLALPHLLEEPSERHSFLKEARTAARLSHPNIVEIYEVGEVDSVPFLAMELIRGRSVSALSKALRATDERLTVGEVCSIVAQAARGLHYAHEARLDTGAPMGLVHRDVSPHNLMLAEDGTVKLVDFGLAKATLAQVTRTVGLKGKLAYMAPEQLKGADIDRRADVFALGAVLFELACGRRLHPGPGEAEIFQQALNRPQTHPAELVDDLPEVVVETILGAIERNPNRRTSSALDIAEALTPLASIDAPSRLRRRLSSHFDPLPRTPDEALGSREVQGGYSFEAREAPSADPEEHEPTAISPPRVWSGPTHPELPRGPTTLRRSPAVAQMLWVVTNAWLDRRLGSAAGYVRWGGAALGLVLLGMILGLGFNRQPVITAVRLHPGAEARAPESAAPTDPPEAEHPPAPVEGRVTAQRRVPVATTAPGRLARTGVGTLKIRTDVPAFVLDHEGGEWMTPLQRELPVGEHKLLVRTADENNRSVELTVHIEEGKVTSHELRLR